MKATLVEQALTGQTLNVESTTIARRAGPGHPGRGVLPSAASASWTFPPMSSGTQLVQMSSFLRNQMAATSAVASLSAIHPLAATWESALKSHLRRNSGLRVSEEASLKEDDVHLDSRYLKVTGNSIEKGCPPP